MALAGDALINAGLAALREQRGQALLPLLEEERGRNPGDARLWHVAGLIERDEERRERALPLLEQAARLAPHEARIQHALARTLHEAGLPSLDAYGAALRLAPGDPELLKGITAALVSEGQEAAALDGLVAILARSPLWADGHRLLADLCWIAGRRDRFLDSLEKALRQEPRAEVLHRARLDLLLTAEMLDEAQAAVRDSRALLGDELFLAAHEAVILAEKGDTEAADRAFAALPGPLDLALTVRWLRHLLRSGRPKEAAAAAENWLGQEEERHVLPYASLAWRMLDDARWRWLEGDSRLVGVYDLADSLPPLERLAETLRALHIARGQPLDQSVRGGTQTDGNLFHRVDPLIVALREAIRSAVAVHAAQLPPQDPGHPLLRTARAPIRFSGSWSVRLREGGSHANHVHPAGWLSSALYIVLPEDLGQEEAGLLTLGEPQAQLGLDLPPTRMVEPRAGRLVLFPSTMWHGTRPFRSGERMTVAFDVAVPR